MVQEIFAVVVKMNTAIFPLQPFPNTCVCILLYIFQLLLLLWNLKDLVIFYYEFSSYFPFPSYESWDSFFKVFTAGRVIIFLMDTFTHGYWCFILTLLLLTTNVEQSLTQTLSCIQNGLLINCSSLASVDWEWLLEGCCT